MRVNPTNQKLTGETPVALSSVALTFQKNAFLSWIFSYLQSTCLTGVSHPINGRDRHDLRRAGHNLRRNFLRQNLRFPIIECLRLQNPPANNRVCSARIPIEPDAPGTAAYGQNWFCQCCAAEPRRGGHEGRLRVEAQ